jgi:hypothetical protein
VERRRGYRLDPIVEARTGVDAGHAAKLVIAT